MADESKAAPSKQKPVKKRALKTAARKDINSDGSLPPPKPKKSRKKLIWLSAIGIIFVLFCIAGLPRTGTIKYGLCKTFVELNDAYPQSLEYMNASESENMVIIDYNRIDGFGQRSLNQIRCYFKDDPQTFYKLERVDVNGKNNILPQESPAVVAKFNNGILALIANKPSLSMPYGLPDDIKDYK